MGRRGRLPKAEVTSLNAARMAAIKRRNATPWSEDDRAIVIDLVMRGWGHADVALMVGRSREAVSALAMRLRGAGLLPDAKTDRDVAREVCRHAV